MENEAIRIIKTRRSVRRYRPDAVPEGVIRDIIDGARLAATARNVQPWEFVVVRDAARRTRISEIAEYGKFIREAPVCIAVLCKPSKYYLEDGCAAIETILLAAWAHGLGTCWVAGDKKDYAAEIVSLLGAPADMRLVGLIAMGQPAETPIMPPKRSLEDVIHWEAF